MKVLDLFCGLGGWSDGFAAEGFEVLGVEIDRKIARLYKHPVIVADVRTLNGEMFKSFDVIVGSPPCRDFSEFARVYGHKWKEPPNPEKGLILVNSFLKFVEKAKPTFWLMENVANLEKFLSLKPKVVTYLTKRKKHGFWGDFPPFLVPRTNKVLTYMKNGKKYHKTPYGKLGSWRYSRIPFPVAQALARATKNTIKE